MYTGAPAYSKNVAPNSNKSKYIYVSRSKSWQRMKFKIKEFCRQTNLQKTADGQASTQVSFCLLPYSPSGHY